MILNEAFKSGIFFIFYIYNGLCQDFPNDNIHRRYEYKYSFKGPYLAQKNLQIPFWTYSGHAIATEDKLRITPSLRSQKGQAWTKFITNFASWEVEIVFRINGRGRTGADGLAFWFTSSPGVEGPVFGSSDMWNGFGLFFDSFDNDHKRNNPYIMGMTNDGTKRFNHDGDGQDQQMGGCLVDFRNKPFATRAKIQYYNNQITVWYHNGMTEAPEYTVCFQANGIYLPNAGYYGLSGATGGLADDQDVLKFEVYSLRPFEAAFTHDAEREKKYQDEFLRYQEEADKARKEYLVQHPDAVPKDDKDEEYMSYETQALRQVFDGQTQIRQLISQLAARMTDLSNNQEKTIRMVSAGGSGVAPPAGQPSTGYVPDSNALNNIIASNRELLQDIRHLKSVVADIQGHTQSLASRGTAQPVGAGSYDMHITLKELNEGVNIVKRDIGHVHQRVMKGDGAGCPAPKCASTWLFVTIIVLQTGMLFAYFVYRDSKEAKAKKFY